MFRKNKNNKSKPDFEMPESGSKRFFFLYKVNFFELVKLSLLFVLFSIPVVTIPASVTALNYVIAKIVNDRLYSVWSDFFKAFKSNFWRSILYGAIFTLFTLSLYWLWTYSEQESIASLAGFFLKFLDIFLLIILLNHAAYFHIIQAWIDLPFGIVFRNAFIIQFVEAKNTLKIFLVLFITLVLLWLLSPVSLMLIPFFSASIVYILSTFAMGPIQKHLVLNDSEQSEPVNPSGSEDSGN